MRIAKRPIDPRLKHYAVYIEVVDLETGITTSTYPSKKVAAISIPQSVRKAGMLFVQELIRKAKG